MVSTTILRVHTYHRRKGIATILYSCINETKFFKIVRGVIKKERVESTVYDSMEEVDYSFYKHGTEVIEHHRQQPHITYNIIIDVMKLEFLPKIALHTITMMCETSQIIKWASNHFIVVGLGLMCN